MQTTGNTSHEEDESEKPNVKRDLFPSEEVQSGQGSLGTDNLPNWFSQQTLGQGARPKVHSPNLFSQQQTPQQFFPSEKMTKNSSHGKPVVKHKVATKKMPGKKNSRNSKDLFQKEQRQQPSRNCKNGITQGFYKLSPRQTSSSSPSAICSPKASVKGKWSSSQCKQHFTDRDKLLTHIKDFHTMKKP